MRYSESDLPSTESTEESLRRENEELRRQLALLRTPAHGHEQVVPAKLWRPSRLTITVIVLGVLLLLGLAFFAGYLPMTKRNTLIINEATERERSLPRVEVVTVGHSSRNSGLELPGNIQAVTEAPILARADGYVKQRAADIGDRVRAGQMLAVIEAPELDEQVRQAQANVTQAKSGVDQAAASLRQGEAELELARVTAKRWGNLVSDGSVSIQENDQYQAQYKAKISNVEALRQSLSMQHGAVAAAEANLARLQNMKNYRVVVAPFDGVITLRNVDSGALVNNGSTLLFRIAQTGALRIYVNVPQTFSNAIHKGDAAKIAVSNVPGKEFEGTVARTANSLDPASRTLLVEIHVPNPSGMLLPGMYAQVELTALRANPPLLIPSDALIAGSDGTQVAIVRPNHKLHLQSVGVGRDFGDKLEVNSGLKAGDTIVANPGDVAHEDTEVDPVAQSGKSGDR
jgi:RND family efflux transporter MFP subunit